MILKSSSSIRQNWMAKKYPITMPQHNPAQEHASIQSLSC